MPKVKRESSKGIAPPVCERGGGLGFTWVHLKELQKEWRGDLQYTPRPVETLEDVAHAARHFIGVCRRVVLSVEEGVQSLQMCREEGCAYFKLLQSHDLPMEEEQRLLLIKTLIDEQKPHQDLRAFMDNQRCPVCLRFVVSVIRLNHIKEENGRLVQAAARLLPDAFYQLEVIHLVDGCSDGIVDSATFILEDRITAAERDWNRLLKAATLARERGLTNDDGSPFFPPRHFGNKHDIGAELLRRNATDETAYVNGKVRRVNKQTLKGKRVVHWYSEPDARKRWPDHFDERKPVLSSTTVPTPKL